MSTLRNYARKHKSMGIRPADAKKKVREKRASVPGYGNRGARKARDRNGLVFRDPMRGH